jgi:hypothetical protein
MLRSIRGKADVSEGPVRGRKIDWDNMTMNIINRLKRAAWSPFKTFVGAIMARGFGVYSYPPASPEPVRLDSHCVLARVGMDSDPFGVTDKGPLFLADNERQSRSTRV